LLGDDLVTVAWDRQTSKPELTVTFQGTDGTKPVNLEGVFRSRIPAVSSFSGGSVQGTLSGALLDATIEPAKPPDPERGISHAIAATGALGNHHFKVLADLDRSQGRGARGSYDGQPIHLDLTATQVATPRWRVLPRTTSVHRPADRRTPVLRLEASPNSVVELGAAFNASGRARSGKDGHTYRSAPALNSAGCMA
jgi:hypothetical protein